MDVIANIVRELVEGKNEAGIEGEKNYFKEPIECYGWSRGRVRALGKRHFDKTWSKQEVFSFCEKLWQSGYMEQCSIACDWTCYVHQQFTADDFEIFDRWVKTYISNWASCDGFCNHAVGEYFLAQYPHYVNRVKQWDKSTNRWVKRASAVSLVIPARNGLFLDDIFEIAETLLTDKDDMVQKGYGWMLKEASKAHLQEVYNFVVARKATMPRTALRYAIEKMPTEMRKKAMEK